MDGLLVIVFFYLLYRLFKRLFGSTQTQNLSKTPFGFDGQLVYSDDGKRSELFVNKIFGLCSKPDFIYKTDANSYTVIEYKGRNGPVYESDEVQLKATVISARSKFNITHAFVFTDSTKKEINVNKTNSTLYKEIEEFTELTRQIHLNKPVHEYTAHTNKCRTCSHKGNCSKK